MPGVDRDVELYEAVAELGPGDVPAAIEDAARGLVEGSPGHEMAKPVVGLQVPEASG